MGKCDFSWAHRSSEDPQTPSQPGFVMVSPRGSGASAHCKDSSRVQPWCLPAHSSSPHGLLPPLLEALLLQSLFCVPALPQPGTRATTGHARPLGSFYPNHHMLRSNLCCSRGSGDNQEKCLKTNPQTKECDFLQGREGKGKNTPHGLPGLRELQSPSWAFSGLATLGVF